MTVRSIITLPSARYIRKRYIKIENNLTKGVEYYIIYDDNDFVKRIKIVRISDGIIYYKYVDSEDDDVREMGVDNWYDIFETFSTTGKRTTRESRTTRRGGTKRRRNKKSRSMRI